MARHLFICESKGCESPCVLIYEYGSSIDPSTCPFNDADSDMNPSKWRACEVEYALEALQGAAEKMR